MKKKTLLTIHYAQFQLKYQPETTRHSIDHFLLFIFSNYGALPLHICISSILYSKYKNNVESDILKRENI